MNRTSHRRGTVLLIVVVIVMLLSLVAYKFLLSMETEHMAAAIQGDRLQAQQSAYSARELCVMLLKKSRSERDAMGGLRDNPSYFAGDMTALTDTTATELTSNLVEQPPFGLVAHALPPLQEGISGEVPTRTPLSSPGNTLLSPPTRYGLINESGKLHLAKILEWETEIPGAGFDALMLLPGMDEATAEALLDWLDPDDDPRASGAESEFYATLTRPIAPRNGLPVDIDELLFVKGITALRLFGTETELPFAASGLGTPIGVNARPIQYGKGQSDRTNTYDADAAVRPWTDYLTIHAAERNESYTGQPRIFLNNENLQELHSTLSGVIPKEWADYIVLYRQFGPSESTPAIFGQAQESTITINFQVPPKFKVENLLDLIATAVTIPAEDEDEEDQTVASPTNAESLAVQAETTEILDLLTVSPNRRVVGRININDAPAEVLAGLPGLSEDTIDSIVAARETGAEEAAASRTHPTWLLTEGLVSLDTMRRLLPHVTCGGDVYRAEIWGRAEEQTPMVHFETVLDASTKQCRPVYYRELDAPRDEIKILSSVEFSSLGITNPNDNRNAF